MRNVRRVLTMVVLAGVFLGPWPWTGCEEIERGMTEGPAIKASAEDLRETVVTPHLESEIGTERNVLWCGSFQLAWNRVCELTGGRVEFLPRQLEIAAILNKRAMTAADIDDGSYVAEAGFVRDGIIERIDRELKKKFGGHAETKLKPDALEFRRPQDIVAYCYLQKDLLFATKFERGDEPMKFGGKSVAWFGMSRGKPDHEMMSRQVSILDYKDGNDFVIELKTKSPKDRLILTKTASKKTLAATIEAVRERMKVATAEEASPDDVLMVPKMNFEITREYTEMEHLRIKKTSPQMPDDLQLLVASQRTLFQLDELGVKLRSESHMEFGCSAQAAPLPEHEMIFDKPFLVMLMREGRSVPYFAMWVGNGDLLVEGK